ncbi:MAG: ankyrin repeat domain-containing protein [Sulfurimonadaceae bacterium]|nr:ankyrin repeat domain-containing protein [Sulfurimonadaceae bacterium]
MSFMERLHSALILKTPMHHPHEAHIIEQPHKEFLDAIRRGDRAEIETLIMDGFDIDHAESTHTPPLIYAILQERSEIIQTLLSNGADVNVHDHKYETPLHTAVKMRQDETLHLLMRYGARTSIENEDGDTPLDLAKNIGYKSGTNILTKTPPMYLEEASLFDAAKRGDLLAIARADRSNDRLFSRDAQDHSLLHLAVKSNHIKLVAYLLNKGLDIDATDSQGNTPLGIAVYQSGYAEMIRYLIKRHATLEHKNHKHQSPLLIAFMHGHIEYINILLESGVDIHTTDSLHTPLTLCHEALEYSPDQAEAFRKIEAQLLIKGAHVDVPCNELGWTPLFSCVTQSNNERIGEVFELLFKLGVNVNHQDQNGRTALMIACSTGRTREMQRLLDNYANADLIDVFGWSALMFAVYYNHVRIVRTLLEYGADVNATSDKGLTALKIAKQYNRKLLEDLLIDYGAIVEDENHE